VKARVEFNFSINALSASPFSGTVSGINPQFSAGFLFSADVNFEAGSSPIEARPG
jgi:hypothetical protein